MTHTVTTVLKISDSKALDTAEKNKLYFVKYSP
jgi:hypothetical protein